MSAIRLWADTMEESLWKKAELGGLLTHKGLVGEQKETQLIQTLADFLPKNICVGRGQLIDSRGKTSAQIDIVVTRGDIVRLPFAETGSNAYLVESALAVMEVKSSLDKTSLADAIQGLASVSSLTIMANVPDPRSADRQGKRAKLTNEEVKPLEDLAQLIYPCSYIYAYAPKTERFVQTFFERMREVVMETQILPNMLPSVIACRGVVAIRNDGVLFPELAFGTPWLYAMRHESHPLYWILAHLTKRLVMVAGQPGFDHAPARLIVDFHLERLPDEWKLLDAKRA